MSCRKIIPASTTTLNQRWFNFNFQRCINVEIRLDLKVGWMLFQRWRRCFNVVSTLFRRCFNIVSTLIWRFINLVINSFFGRQSMFFFIYHTRNLFFFYFIQITLNNFLSVLLQYTLICSLVTNSTESRIILVHSRIWCRQRPLACLRSVESRTFPIMRKKNSICNRMYQKAQQSTWLTILILSYRIIFCKSKIFSHSLPAHPRYRTGIMLQINLALCLFWSWRSR